jgi:hypothetical protein
VDVDDPVEVVVQDLVGVEVSSHDNVLSGYG